MAYSDSKRFLIFVQLSS